MGKKGIFYALFDRPKDVGYRIGFIALLLIVITAVFPAFTSIGTTDPKVSSFQAMFLTGLVGTMMFGVMLRNVSVTKNRGTEIFSPQNMNKQMAVLMVGIMGGLVIIMANALIYGASGANVLLGSAWGTINEQALYMGILAGVSEELFFRGFIGTFVRIVAPNLLFSVVISAAIFSLFHWFAYSTPVAFVILFIIGLFLGFLHEFTNDIGAPMIAHILNNSFAMMPMVLAWFLGNLWILALLIAVFVLSGMAATFARKKTIGGLKIG